MMCRMKRSTGAVVLMVAASALAGCGEQGRSADEAPSLAGTTSVSQPLPAASKLPTLAADQKNLPDCRATWRPGKTLPQHYDGCVDNAMEVPVAATGHECADGSRLVNFRGRQWAMTGGPISITDGDKLLEDSAYLKALETCQPA
jgi:hypothetical protein